MSNDDIIRAWKDDEYRNSLSAEKRAQLPENPADIVELNDYELAEVSGAKTSGVLTAGCCQPTIIGLTQCGLLCPSVIFWC